LALSLSFQPIEPFQQNCFVSQKQILPFISLNFFSYTTSQYFLFPRGKQYFLFPRVKPRDGRGVSIADIRYPLADTHQGVQMAAFPPKPG
jgi:hypothetical protein